MLFQSNVPSGRPWAKALTDAAYDATAIAMSNWNREEYLNAVADPRGRAADNASLRLLKVVPSMTWGLTFEVSCRLQLAAVGQLD